MDELFEYAEPRDYERLVMVRMVVGAFITAACLYSSLLIPVRGTVANELVKLAVALMSIPGVAIVLLASPKGYLSTHEFYGLAAKVAAWVAGGIVYTGLIYAMIRLAARYD